jgi:hypothetical protein
MSRLLEPRWWALLLTRAVLAGLVVLIGACVLWRVQGGHWERVETPSMGSRAPVGSLLWVSPVDDTALREGDFVTVRPPGSAATYSHLVETRDADGAITTRGVLSGSDPWRLAPTDVVGRVSATWWGVGWLVAAAPLLLVGGLVVAALRRAVPAGWRSPATLVLASGLVAVAIVVHQPLLGAQQLGFVAAGGSGTPGGAQGGAEATYVGTGLLPVRLEAPDGSRVVLDAGEVGTVRVPADQADAQGRLQVELGPDVPLWWWVVLVLGCFVPAAGATLGAAVRAELRRRRGSRGRASAAGCHRRPRAAFR